MFWLTSKMTAVPISGGTRSQMRRKQAMRAAAEAGVTTTPRAILQFWLDFHPRSLVVCSSPSAQNLFTSASFHSLLLLQQSSFQYLFSLLFSFHLYSHNYSYITKILHNLPTCYHIGTFMFIYTLSCFSPALSIFGAGSTVSCEREPHTFSALGTRVINLIYLSNVPVISLLQIAPDLDN